MDQNAKTLNPMNMNVTHQTPQSFFSPSGSDLELRASKKLRIAQPCLQFNRGRCSFGHNCKYSHSMRDAENVLSPLMMDKENTVNVCRNSNNEYRPIFEKGFCWRFCNGKECWDGERCRYRHEIPLNLRTVNPKSVGQFTRNGVGQVQCRTPECVDVLGKSVYRRPMFGKARLCNHWEARSSCPYGGNCNFAHGFAELQKVWPDNERGCRNVSTVKMMSSAATLAPFCRMKSGDAFNQKRPQERCQFKWKSFEKMNGIYADWIQDTPVVDSLLGQVENSN